jgi:hypothetical protein
LLANVSIQEAIAEGRARLEREGIVTQDAIFRGFLQEANGGDDSRAADRIAAWEHLAKLLGMYKRAELKVELEAMEAEDAAGLQKDDPRKTATEGSGEAPPSA